MSQHKVEIVPVKLEKHPNADSLSIVKVLGYTVCARTSDWQGVEKAAYIEPDYVVPADRPEFSFLADTHKLIENNGVKGYRIKVKRLRSVMSMGLLIPAPENSQIGDNVIEQLGIVRYEPPMPMTTRGESTKPPPGIRHCYDVESAYRYEHLFTDGEEVVATEKVHGANARYCYVPELGMFAGSRTEWKKKEDKIIWWKALSPELEKFCIDHPEVTVYGEVYGQVQDLTYGVDKGKILFIAFDLLRNGEWVDHDEARELASSLTWVPVIYRGPWQKEKIFELAEGKSEVAKWNKVSQIREGIVVKPVKERNNLEIGRTQLKIVSNSYLERQ
jgi:RNA ligase (TIGR02306 family)